MASGLLIARLQGFPFTQETRISGEGVFITSDSDTRREKPRRLSVTTVILAVRWIGQTARNLVVKTK